jgi:hypothetical protein
MSSNRSVQAAQRRRAGPTSEPGIPGRGPQPSINSAQMFANQARPGQGPSMPTGRLAGQQAAMQQQQMQQQMGQPMPAPQPVPKSILKRTSMGPFSINNKNIRNGVIVVVLFILLNSKFIWRALTRIPMMGTFEPSILALIVNSLLAGIVFYIISTKINN